MPNNFSVTLKNRDFTPRDPLLLNIQVTEYSFVTKGGPYRATLEATGDVLALWALFNDLRCPVEIYDDLGVRVWWGLVYEVKLTTGKMTFKASLADVFNKVSVGYSFIEPGTNEVGQRKNTTALSDTDSQAEYGVKELLQLSGGLSDDEANALTAGLLFKYAWPKGGLSSTSYSSDKTSATIYLRGWWDTAFWQYASKSTTASTELSVQVKDLLATFAPLLSGVEMDATAISTSNYRDGSKYVGEVVEEIGAASDATGLDCTISVDANRLAYIAREPLYSSVEYTMGVDGVLFTTAGEMVRKTTPPVGVYVKTSDIIPAVVNQVTIKDAGLQFITESGWRRGEPYYIFRDVFANAGIGSVMGWGSSIANSVLPMVADWVPIFRPLSTP